MPEKVYKYTLANGLTILVKENHNIPKVSTQLWYNVGSKDELSGQRGIAHFIEHMIFKGTKNLSECDINIITHKLSGYTNAFTSYDYTGYMFDFPTQNWKECLPIMADCMRNCTFKQEFLSSELKAVIQELKMYKDDYLGVLIESLISAIFRDHPYHHPVIGYKQDLWNIKREAMVDFYNYHYTPNNATLIVIGDVQADQVFELADKNFSYILPNPDYKKTQFYHSIDLSNYEITLYRDIQQPMVVLTWVIPGLELGQDYIVDLVVWILGAERGSRLYKKLVEDLELVTEIEAVGYDMFEHGLFLVYFSPKETSDINKIIDIIHEEIELILTEGLEPIEITRAVKKIELEHLALLEDNQKQAYAIGKYYLAVKNENYLSNYLEFRKENLENKVKEFISNFLKRNLAHHGKILPIHEKDKQLWLNMQQISDNEDQIVLSQIERNYEIEPPKCAVDINPNPPTPFNYPKYQPFYINDGLKILSHNDANFPKIDFILDYKAKHYYDPDKLQGLGSFVASMLLEGTKNYTSMQFADTLESLGMSINSYPGYLAMSMLAVDLAKGFELASELLTQASFDQQSIEKVRDQMLVELKQFWDQPSKFVTQICRSEIYKNHPYGKNILGTVESLNNIKREDLINYYKAYLTPKDSALAIVGDMQSYDLKEMMEHLFYNWQGSTVEDINFPAIEPIKYKEINYPIMRDQTVLAYAGISVSRIDPDYDKILLFDQIFTGGVLGSMASRLFDLREQTGLFYTISGSLIYAVDKQPGMIFIKTIVSNDRLEEAEKAIEYVIQTALDVITEDEFEQAKNAIINSLVDNFAGNYAIASTMLFLNRYNLPQDYFDNRASEIEKITIEEVREAVKKYLDLSKMIKVRAGRI